MDQEQQNQNQGMNDTLGESPKTGVPLSSVPEEKTTHVGPLIGIIIIVVVIILGGLYFWGQKVSNTVPPFKDAASDMTAEKVAGQADAALNALETQGTSDAVADIEADVNATNLGGLDAEAGNIESQLNP